MILKLDPEKRKPAVRSVQEMLNFLGFRSRVGKPPKLTFQKLKEDGFFGPVTEDAVIDFQRSEGLLQDGVIGTQTMRALEDAFSARTLELHSPGFDFADGAPDRHVFDRVDADLYEGEGYGRLSLRDDAAAKYRSVREQARAAGALLTSSGGIRSIHAKLTKNRSPCSFHYLGLALDLYIYSGMVDASKDPYVIVHEEDRRFRVFARCSREWARDAELPESRELENVVTYDQRQGNHPPVEGPFLDLTDLFARHGFEPIRARRRFFEGGSMMGAEWWHFQYEKGLIEGASTFGGELLKVYSEDTLEETAPWRERDRIFGINWS